MVAVYAVLLVLVVIGIGTALTNLRPDDGRPAPQFAINRECPTCGHRMKEHRVRTRLSHVRQGCKVDGCECNTPITDSGFTYRRW